jgi:signal peptidase II
VPSRFYRGLAVLAILMFIIAGDQAAKNIAKTCLPKHTVIPVIGNLFILTYTENDGGFLSLGSTLPAAVKPVLLTFFPVLIMLALLLLVIRGYVIAENMRSGKMAAFCCVIGGGLGNIFDRLVNHGLVVDFMNFGIGNLRTGVLNVADLFITFGIVLLFFKRK